MPNAKSAPEPSDFDRVLAEEFDRYFSLTAQDQETYLRNLRRRQPGMAAQLERLIAFEVDPGSVLVGAAIQHLGKAKTLSRKSLTFWDHQIAYCLTALFVLSLFLWAFTVFLRFRNQLFYSGWHAHWTSTGAIVTEIDASGPAAGLVLPGDRILSINGDSALLVGPLPLNSRHAYRMEVDRQGTMIDLNLKETIKNVPDLLSHVAILYFVSFVYFLVAFAIALFRPTDFIGQFAPWPLTAEALVLLQVSISSYMELVPSAELWLFRVIALSYGIHFALAYDFYRRFFDAVAGTPRRHRSVPVIYAWSLLTTLSVHFDLGTFRWAWMLNHPLFFLVLLRLADAFFFVAPAAICWTLVAGYRQAGKRPTRVRACWIAYGSLAGILPYTIYRLWLFVAQFHGVTGERPQFQSLFYVCILASLSIPFTTAYAVLRHRLFEIQVYRRLQFRILLGAWLFLPLLAMAGTLISVIPSSDKPVAEALWRNRPFLLSSASLLVLLALLLPVIRQLKQRFNRDEGKRAQRLLRFLAHMRASRSLADLVVCLKQHLGLIDPFVLAMVGFADPSDGSFVLEAVRPHDNPSLRIPAQSLLLSALQRNQQPQYLFKLQNLIPGSLELDRFRSQGFDLAVPIAKANRELVGLLLLCSKKEGYLPTDLEALQEAAAVIADAYSSIRQAEANSIVPHQTQEHPHKGLLQECPTCRLCFDSERRTCPEDSEELILTFPIECKINDQYRLERRLQAGGMGTVYLARDLRFGRVVAVKLIACPQGATSEGWHERVRREALALGKLSHPNIVTGFACGTVKSGVAYLVMEYIDGITLRQALLAGPISPERAAGYFHQILDALAAAHSAGVIHRDLKPENVMLAHSDTGNELIKVLDFGISKILDPQGLDASLTQTGLHRGTPDYIAPEQLTGEPANARSDLYSIGVMILEVLSAGDVAPLSERVRRFNDAFSRERALTASTDSDLLLLQALQKCLAPRPEQRFATARHLQHEIIPLIRAFRGRARSASL